MRLTARFTGCHGSGKTNVAEAFAAAGVACMDEGFMDQPVSLLHPQSLLSETSWVVSWFQRLMDHVMAARKAATASAAAAASSTSTSPYGSAGPLVGAPY